MKSIKDISIAAAHLAAGKLVAFPTETVYGLGGDGCNDAAVAAIFAAKGRPQFNPLIVHVADAGMAFGLGKFNETAIKLAEAFWPGPLTLVVPRADDCPVSLLVSAGLDSLAIRVPAHPVAHGLLKEFGGPVAAPSANRSGAISPTTPEHVAESLGERIDLVLDGGDCSVGVESTIVSCLAEPVVILRHGGISRGDIEQVVGAIGSSDKAADKAPVAPGQLTSHYAPNATLRLDVTVPAGDETLLGFGPVEGAILNLSQEGDVVEAAANLFKMLHELDRMGVAKIAVSPIPNKGLGEAINDRLKRAAAPRGGVN